MESDSDHFESADENFDSDDNETENEIHKQIKTINKNEHIDSNVSAQIKRISLEDKIEEKNNEKLTCVGYEENDSLEIDNCSKQVNKSTESVSDKQENNSSASDNQSNASSVKRTNFRERKERTPKMKSKLGVKLGTKIEKNIEYEQFKNPVPIPDQQAPQQCWEDVVGWAPFKNDLKSSKLYSQKPEPSEKTYWDNEADYMELPQKENFQNVADKLSAGDRPQSSSGWGNWSNWGVSSILSTATLGVSTLTNSVSQGITTVLETGIGAPDPEELARIDRIEIEKRNSTPSAEMENPAEQNRTEKQSSSFGLGNLVSGVTHITKLVETTGTKVLSGGLDTLEVIGKKTMEVLQEGDPGFKKKKAFLGFNHDKPVLSQVLREAKEKAEEENKFLEERHFAKKAHYETLFDDHQGLVHLEALEMLSKQCDIKLESLIESYTGNELTEFQETMTQIKELCEIPDEDEDTDTIDIEAIKEKLDSAVSELNVTITYEHLLKTWNEVDDWLHDAQLTEKEIHQNAIETLAKLTAISVEQFHKAGELLLVKDRRSTVDEADSLVQLTTTLTSLIGMAAGKFSEKLNTLVEFSTNPESVNGLITNIFLEAANSSSYIQDAFQLLIPVLQAGAV